MNLWQRFKRLGLWPKLGVVAALCTILAPFWGLARWLLAPGREDSVKVEVQDSPNATVQTAINSPNATQVVIENPTIKLSPQLERKLTIAPEYVNQP